MVSYTRLLLLVLVGLGTPMFLLFQGSMNLGQQIAAGTVLLAFLALFVLIFADFLGSSFAKQVDGDATIRPFLCPLVHLNPLAGAPPFFLLKICDTPSVIAE